MPHQLRSSPFDAGVTHVGIELLDLGHTQLGRFLGLGRLCALEIVRYAPLPTDSINFFQASTRVCDSAMKDLTVSSVSLENLVVGFDLLSTSSRLKPGSLAIVSR